MLTVLCDDQRPPDMAEIEQTAEVRYTAASGLAAALPGTDALYVYAFRSTALARAWHAADRLRWLHVAAAGVDPVLFPELVASDVTLTNARGVFDQPIAEYVLGTIIAFAKDFPGSWRLQQQHVWRHRDGENVAGNQVHIVGTGPIGRAIARLLRAVGMRVTGVGRRAREADPDFGVVYPSAELPERLPEAGYVVAVAPLTAETSGMFDATAFAAMRPSARFVNVGRGELVVTDDLINALQAGELAAAALDVCDPEPLPADSPLWRMTNVFVSPHMAGDVRGWREQLGAGFAENFRRWRDGLPLRNVVDKQLGYVPSE